MAHHPSELSPAGLAFLREWHLATLSTHDLAGHLHVVPVGFTYDAAAHRAGVITSSTTRKVANVRAGGTAALCQVDHARWLTMEGTVEVLSRREAVADGELRYAERYRRSPRPNPERVVLMILVARVMGSAEMLLA